ncbi:MAG: hypothetical protein IPJ81_07915 [Chitinophagaceae bacterium]|nr:hypothetical protein [Chitinophagaceae bacterium]
MRKVFISAAFVLISLVILKSNSKPAQSDLTVHEWGTFTTLHDSKGNQLSGVYLEEEGLPRFVHSLSPQYPSVKGGKGFTTPENVTVKMETPVIYFYSPKAINASVKVDFPQGAIGQWYPEIDKGKKERNNYSNRFNFKESLNDWVKWDVKVLEPNSNETLPVTEMNTWLTPRATDANIIQYGKETEKYIFTGVWLVLIFP